MNGGMSDDEIQETLAGFLEKAHARMQPDDDFRAESVYTGIAFGPATVADIAAGSDPDDPMATREVRYWIAAFREVGIPIRQAGGEYSIGDADLDRADALWIEHFGKRYGGNLLVERNDLGEWVDARGRD